MLMQIGQKPESDFSEPIGMLEDCHKRIRFFLESLIRVSQTATGRALTDDQRTSLERALKYFREAAPKHTADEEESLFPQLRLIGAAQIDKSLAELDDLENDHRRAEIWHEEVDVAGSRWLLQGALSDDDLSRMRVLLKDLSDLYERHIAFEESEIFSLAKRLLPESGKRLLGEEMARRRGLRMTEGLNL